MKKRLILSMAALVAVTLTSCQKDQVINQVPQEQAIEFGTYLGRDAQTKGEVIDNSNLKTKGFGVYAYYTGTASINNYTPTNANFMDNQLVKYETNAWTYSPVKYWPNSEGDKLSFYAYAPYNNDYTAATNVDKFTNQLDNSSKLPTVTYIVDEEISKHIDVLFAIPVQDMTKPANNEKVTLKFYHALSRVGFRVVAGADIAPATITLNSLTLSGKFFEEQTLNLATSSVTLDNETLKSTNPNWSLGTKVQKNFTKGSLNQVVGTTSAAVGNETEYLMIFPQQFDSNKALDEQEITISVNYTITYSDGVSIPNSVSNSLEFTFEAGKAYTFTVKISGLNEVQFDASVADWNVAAENAHEVVVD